MTVASRRRLAQAAAKAKADAGPPVTRDVLEAATRLQLTSVANIAIAQGDLTTAFNEATVNIMAMADRYKAGDGLVTTRDECGCTTTRDATGAILAHHPCAHPSMCTHSQGGA